MLQVTAGADHTNQFSQAGANTNPIRFAFDGRIGGVIERLYYLTHDDETTEWTDLTVQPIANVAKDIVNGTDGYSIKVKAGAVQPTAQEWATISHGNRIEMPDLPDNLTFLPFWVRIEVPKGAPVDTVLNTVIRAIGTESVIS